MTNKTVKEWAAVEEAKKAEVLTSSQTIPKPIVSSSAFGHYNDELVFVNDKGEEVCEWCGSINFQKVDGCENWLCECGSHW